MKKSILTTVAAIFAIVTIAHADDINISITNNNSNVSSITNDVVASGGQASASQISSIIIEEILREIKTAKDELVRCSQYGFRNLKLRHKLVVQNTAAFRHTGDKKYLKEATFHAGAAEKNYKKGNDIKKHLPEAKDVMTDVYLHWEDCIRKLQGPKAARKFARTKSIEQKKNKTAKLSKCPSPGLKNLELRNSLITL